MENNILERIEALEKKIDLILDHMDRQRRQTAVVTDLSQDLSIITKDLYDTAVAELDKRQIEVDPNDLTDLAFALVRNVKNFKEALNGFEMMMDFIKEVQPIANDAIIEWTHMVAEFDQKGYFEFFRNVMPVLDNIVSGLSREDLVDLSENVMTIIHTMKDLTQPQMLKSIDNAVKVYSSIETENIPSYSIWKFIREINSPEMKKAFGFALTFLKNMSKNIENQSN